jgi:hypothetical protein
MPAQISIEDVLPQIRILQGFVELRPVPERTQEVIREVVFETSKALPQLKELGEETLEVIARYLETQFDITQESGHAITALEFEPWLLKKKPEIDFHYWNRLNLYLRAEGDLPPQVISILDNTTDQILDYVGNPKLDGSMKRRGMVIGHVQSGKTSNYSALICKAADAGYKIIILLAGITNSLRTQTQERINLAFIGKNATSNTVLSSEVIGAAKHVGAERPRHPDWGTTIENDFGKGPAATAAGFQMENRTQPLIYVLKKNPNTLNNMIKYLDTISPNASISYPLLLIDDEADNASINVAKDPDAVSKINASIRQILLKFEKSSYVGYTATPFANIFIDPDNDDEMIKDDLFPSDYIKVLDAPTNYVGPDAVFGEEGKLSEKMVLCPTDYEIDLPLNHKNHREIDGLPKSLEQAVRLFIIAKAVRIYRGDGKKHSSMMVNVSRFNSVQDRIHGLIYSYLTDLRNDIRLNSARKDRAKLSAIMKLFEQDYSLEFIEKSDGELYPKWSELKLLLVQASEPIQVQIVNQSGGALDYGRYSETGFDVIAIGGLALSRGLTLEGLCISYVLRNASAYDTLMQMGRWFGYRRNYEDLCRLYLPSMSRDYYQDVAVAISELRDEIENMEQLKLTPVEFGLKVREHPEAIRITAANKMRSAEKIRVSIGLQGKHVEAHAIFYNDASNNANRQSVSRFIERLGDPEKPPSVTGTEFFWGDVAVQEILKFMVDFKVPGNCRELCDWVENRSLAADFIESARSELSLWDVCITSREADSTDFLADKTLIKNRDLKPRNRNKGSYLGKGIYAITKNRRVSSGEDAGIGLTRDILGKGEDGKRISGSDKKYNQLRLKPLLLIHVIKPETEDDVARLENNIVTYGIDFPGAMKAESITKEYQANRVYQQLNLYEDFDDRDEDEELEEFFNE